MGWMVEYLGGEVEIGEGNGEFGGDGERKSSEGVVVVEYGWWSWFEKEEDGGGFVEEEDEGGGVSFGDCGERRRGGSWSELGPLFAGVGGQKWPLGCRPTNGEEEEEMGEDEREEENIKKKKRKKKRRERLMGKEYCDRMAHMGGKRCCCSSGAAVVDCREWGAWGVGRGKKEKRKELLF